MAATDLKNRERKIRNITLWGILINVVLMGLKLAFGFLVRSSSLIADGIHSLSDLVTDIIVLVGAHISNRPADRTHAYGHRKIETITTQLIGLILLAVSIGLIWENSRAVFEKQAGNTGYAVVLAIAVLSVVSKELIFWFTRIVAKITDSPSLYANAWHHRSDAFSSVAVLVGGVAGSFGWGPADHAAAVVVGLMIAAVAGKILYEGLKELTDHSLDDSLLKKIEGVLEGERKLCSWHALRTRKIGGELFIDVHLLCAPDLSVREGHRLAVYIEKKIRDELERPIHMLVHIEPNSEDRHVELESS